MKPEFNCYSRHIALCYQYMNRTGMTAQRYAMRKETRNSMTQGGGPRALELPIAGKVVSRAIPKRRNNITRKAKRKTLSTSSSNAKRQKKK